jgi:hypothetical protein
MYTSVVGVWLVTNPTNYTTTRLSMLEKNTRVEVTDLGVGKSYNVDPTTRWWKVTVVDGRSIGKVGWVMEKDLSDTKT